MMTRWMLLFALGLAACDGEDTKDTDTTAEADTDTDADADTDTDTDADTDTDTNSCAALDVDSCAANGNCRVITGRTLQETSTGVCVDFSEEPIPLGCMDAKDGCGDAETLATQTEGTCTHWFSDTCIPEGWSTCTDLSVADECP